MAKHRRPRSSQSNGELGPVFAGNPSRSFAASCPFLASFWVAVLRDYLADSFDFLCATRTTKKVLLCEFVCSYQCLHLVDGVTAFQLTHFSDFFLKGFTLCN